MHLAFIFQHLRQLPSALTIYYELLLFDFFNFMNFVFYIL